jgi:hypothetical protein
MNMVRFLLALAGGLCTVLMIQIRVDRLKEAGHISSGANGLEILWSAFLSPMLKIVWAGLYEMIRTTARGSRQKPPLRPFLAAWMTGKVQTVTKRLTVTTAQGVKREIMVSEQIKPPRPPGRPRKYPEGWRKARLTGRPRGRPRKQAHADVEGNYHGS